MQFTLESEELTVQVQRHGAELLSIKNKAGEEYLWQANPGIWPRRAPVLFPIVGKLIENRYTYNQQAYRLPQHGFARDMDFELSRSSSQELEFTLHSSETSKLEYPFDFTLKLGYSLIQNTLRCSYWLSNTGGSTMLFSLGAHPGFVLPNKQNQPAPYLSFQTQELFLTPLRNGLITEEKRRLKLEEKQLTLSAELFHNDALVMQDRQIEYVSLNLDQKGKRIELYCKGWTNFGIWSKPDPNTGELKFICLEPWHGIADSVKHDGAFENKRGLLRLQPEKCFESAFELRFY